MIRRNLFAAAALALATVVAALPARSEMPPFLPVYGVIVDRMNMPVPGLVVRLQNQQIGPSIPVVTGPTGNYYLENIPRNVLVPYVLEVWWGQMLVFRTYLSALGPQQVIRLP